MSHHGAGPSPSEGSPIAVIDIDGVLADVRHRLHHIAGRPKDWDSFFAEVDRDPLLAAGARAVAQASADGLRIVYLTGRPERSRSATQAWLERWHLPAGRLVMRSDRDRRPARMFKVEQLERLSAVSDVAFLLDDDDAVCDAAERAGFTVRRADWVDRGEDLRTAQDVTGRT